VDAPHHPGQYVTNNEVQVHNGLNFGKREKAKVERQNAPGGQHKEIAG
jgi:hypothetical protein